MCVIAFSPKGNDMPTEEDIKKMFKKNHDGAGYAYEEGDTVKFRKGFMNVDDLLEDLGPLEKWKDKNIAMHFRIGTAGKNDKKTTHPFPISNKFGDLRKLRGEGPVLFHNGVISGLGGIIDPLASDTQDFVAGVASKLLTRPNKPTKITEAVVESVIGASRLLLMYGKGKIVRFGDWKEKDGNLYSNLFWDFTPTTTTYSTKYSYGYYDSDKYDLYESENAWPGEYHQWISVSPARGEQIAKQAKVEDDGYYHFNACPKLQWLTNEDNTEWYTLNAVQSAATENKEYYRSDEYEWFEDYREFEVWKIGAIEMTDGTYEKNGKIWYFDEKNLEVFTENAVYDLTDCADAVKALEFCKIYGYLPEDDEEIAEMEARDGQIKLKLEEENVPY